MLTSSPNFKHAIDAVTEAFYSRSKLVHTEKWQGVKIKTKPEMATYELLNYSLEVPVGTEDLDYLRDKIKPNIPWADDHFDERVCGVPINPGVEWANWPYGKMAANFLKEGKFNHNYMERYWPKYAGLFVEPTFVAEDYYKLLNRDGELPRVLSGIYHDYGDLDNVVSQLVREPDTRQAYFPVWFPEDTGVVHGSRVPCSLGYHFIVRDGRLHCNYYLRSCDFVRHFRDDVYLTVRLMLWILGQCRKRDERWNDVLPGTFTMHITSLHMFKADWQPLFGGRK